MRVRKLSACSRRYSNKPQNHVKKGPENSDGWTGDRDRRGDPRSPLSYEVHFPFEHIIHEIYSNFGRYPNRAEHRTTPNLKPPSQRRVAWTCFPTQGIGHSSGLPLKFFLLR